MGKRLTGHTTVTNPESGEAQTFTPDDIVPSWAEELITNPSAWVFVDEDTGESVTVDDAIASMSRDDLIRALEGMNLIAGEDFPKSASKEKLATILRERAGDHPSGGEE
jgi:hypothetical protein